MSHMFYNKSSKGRRQRKEISIELIFSPGSAISQGGDGWPISQAGSPHLSSHRERGGEVWSEMERVEKFQLTSSPSSIAPTKTCQDQAIAKLIKEGGSSEHISISNFFVPRGLPQNVPPFLEKVKTLTF